MDTPKAIVLGAAMISVAIVLSNLHQLAATGGSLVYRMNTLTGALTACATGAPRCITVPEAAKQ